jgi:hypothetical protein
LRRGERVLSAKEQEIVDVIGREYLGLLTRHLASNRLFKSILDEPSLTATETFRLLHAFLKVGDRVGSVCELAAPNCMGEGWFASISVGNVIGWSRKQHSLMSIGATKMRSRVRKVAHVLERLDQGFDHARQPLQRPLNNSRRPFSNSMRFDPTFIVVT